MIIDYDSHRRDYITVLGPDKILKLENKLQWQHRYFRPLAR